MGRKKKKTAKEVVEEVIEEVNESEVNENIEQNDAVLEETKTEEAVEEKEQETTETIEQAECVQSINGELTTEENSEENCEAEPATDEHGEKNSEFVEEQKEELSNVDAFLSSLDKQTESNIETKPKKKKLSVWQIVIVACVSVFLVAAILIGINMYDSHSSNKLGDDMNKDFFEGSDRTDLMPYLSPFVLSNTMPKYGSPRNANSNMDYEIIETNNPLHKQFKEKLIEYQKINSDIYGWMQVDGTTISYAVVKGADNDYYLDHTVTKEYNANGAIFADYKCEDNILDNPNLVFYGHNSVYLQQMFNQLTKFLDEAFFKQNRYVTIYTLDGVYRYEIFSIYETHSSYKYCQTSFISNNSFVNWCNDMKENSMYTRDITDFTENSRILTLSTCTNGYFTRRYSLQAKLVLVEK